MHDQESTPKRGQGLEGFPSIVLITLKAVFGGLYAGTLPSTLNAAQ
jgi:hypothetical protein